MARNTYFPPGVLGDSSKKNLIVSWYEAFLEAMDEEALYPVRKRPTTYRILRLPTFSQPSAVRVFRSNDGWRIVGKVTDGQGGYFPGKLGWNLERTLDLSESQQLEQLMHRLQFWAMSVNDDRFGFDGETWLIEGVQDDKYHVVHRWSPQEGPVLDVGEFLQMVSGVTQYRPDPQIQEQRIKAAQEAAAETNRKRSEAIHRSNTMARSLAAKLTSEGLMCPHCRKRTREVRFIDKSPHGKSYFICRSCGRSFRSEEYQIANGA